MITISVVRKVETGKGKEKTYVLQREVLKFHSIDKARAEITPIVKEMNLAQSQKRQPKVAIEGVSYDSKSERQVLLELKAITSIDNESGGY